MRNVLILLVGLVVSGCAMQNTTVDDGFKIPENYGFVLNEKGIVEYNGVYEIDESAMELYNRARRYFATEYRSAQDVLQMDDADSQLIGKANTKVSGDLTGFGRSEYTMRFTIDLQFRDGRYRFAFYNFSLLWPDGTDYSLEAIYCPGPVIRSKVNQMGKYNAARDIQHEIRRLIYHLRDYMHEKGLADDW